MSNRRGKPNGSGNNSPVPVRRTPSAGRPTPPPGRKCTNQPPKKSPPACPGGERSRGARSVTISQPSKSVSSGWVSARRPDARSADI